MQGQSSTSNSEPWALAFENVDEGMCRNVDDEDGNFQCDPGSECEHRVRVVAECSLYKKEREVYMTEMEKITVMYREMFGGME